MARELKITGACKLQLEADAGAGCVIEKVVDVTEDCPRASNEDRYVFLYTRTKHGRVVKILRPQKGGEYMGIGMFVYFPVNELEGWMHLAPRNDAFGWWASGLGLSKSALCSLIETHAPTV